MRKPATGRIRSHATEWVAVLALLLGCSAGQDSLGSNRAGTGGSAGVTSAGGSSSLGGAGALPGVGNASGAAGVGGAAEVEPRCHAPVGVSGSPRTIAEAIALLNALPKPTSVACFVESLDRPLFAYATSSTISAQPALSFRSPRIFLRENQLLLSVVIEGPYSWLVEFSELIENDTRSIKGELLFPLAAAVAAAAPYDRIRYAQGTVCGTCHGSEERAPSVDFTEAFSSTAFRPNLTFRVSLDSLVHEQQICDPSVEPERCQLLSAIFAGGPVSEAQFSQTMTLFY